MEITSDERGMLVITLDRPHAELLRDLLEDDVEYGPSDEQFTHDLLIGMNKVLTT